MSEQPPEPAPGPPSLEDVELYLGTSHTMDDAALYMALLAEKAAQRSVCNVPEDHLVWPADLREALFRRVAHNLAMRTLPLAVHSTVSDAGSATVRVGGTDPEVRRLEAPYRKRKLA